MSDAGSDELVRLRRDRDLYLAMLELGSEDRLESFLVEALALLVASTGAAQGYLELRDPEAAGGEGTFWIAHSCTEAEVEEIRASVSRGIVGQTLATGRTILTHSALLDERFRERESVRARSIEAVLCAPIGGDAARGVVYLQGSSGAFSEEDRRRAELLAIHLAPLAERLVTRARVAGTADPTRELRSRYRLEGLVGRSAAMAQALEQAMLAAPLDVSVLLTGPSGSGKSVLARAIHVNSRRASGPFVEVNCAALPETLVESELFGALAGSHSEARRNQQGKVAAAEGGTLFLDEVGEIPFGAQAKLLQLLQSRQYYPLGASSPVRADVRLVAASNADLHEAVRTRRFREDLLYRLQVLPIRLPSLAERREDLPALAEHLAGAACRRHGLPPLAPSAAALRAILVAEWLGNVRELEHAVEAAAIRAAGKGSPRIEPHHLFPATAVPAEGTPEPLSFREATRLFQRELLEKTLEECGWNVAEAARRLDLARSHVYNLIREFGMERDIES
jgi:DNA-binding NtrC family response regulator